MGGYVPSVLAKTIESVKEATGIDISEIMKANTYDAKVNRNVSISGLPEGNGEATASIVAGAVQEALENRDGLSGQD